MQDITHTTYDGGANPYAAGGAAAAAGATSEVYNELPPAQRSIMTFIASRAKDPEQGEEGIHVEAVVRSMGGSEAKVRAEIATLIEDGHLYETIDDQQCVLLIFFFVLSLSSFSIRRWRAHLVLMPNPGLCSVLPTA
jgi:replication factor A2